MSAATRAVHVLIHGRVQGVGFRAWTAARAEDLGLCGYVRNRWSGSVEAEFSGPAEAVSAMLDLCRKGPPGAMVRDVEIVGEGVSAATVFAVLPTV